MNQHGIDAGLITLQAAYVYRSGGEIHDTTLRSSLLNENLPDDFEFQTNP